MSEHLEKSKDALTQAGKHDTTDPVYRNLLHIAEVQAQVAQACALERIANRLESRQWGTPVTKYGE
jgi:hypothetical protein